MADGKRAGDTQRRLLAWLIVGRGQEAVDGGGGSAAVCGVNLFPTFQKYTEITPARVNLVIIDYHARSSKLHQVNGAGR